MLSETKEFYKGIRVPSEIDNSRFVRFAAKIDGIMSQFLTTGQMIKFSVSVENSSSAYIDFSQNKIALPKWYVSKEAMEKLLPSENPVDVSIALVNGSAAHESLHGKWTKIDGDYTKWLARYFTHEIVEYGKNFVAAIVNICEDVYIESRGDNPFQIFTDAKNSILFQDFAVDENSIINTIVQFKNKNHRNALSKVLSPNQFDALMAFVDAIDSIGAESRVSLFKNAIEAFAPDKQDADDNSDEGEGQEGEGQEDEGQEGEGQEGEGSGEGSDSESESGEPNTGKSETAGASSKEIELASDVEDDAEVEKIAKELESKIEKIKEDNLVEKSRKDGFLVGEILEVEIEDVSKYSRNLSDPTIDPSFVRVLRSVRHKNTTKGEQRTRGSAINASQLYRISTDQKVFAEPHRYDAKAEEIEIGILIDASGSMSGSLFNGVCNEVMGFSDAMVAARIPHFVDAHTSTWVGGTDTPLMVRVLRSKVDGTTPDRRHNMELLKGGLDLVQNYDGFMVERATEHFTKKEGRKILLVLSDGEPYAPAYNGSMADAHTKQKIAEARKKGFVVISISLVSEVVEANNEIYGREWNIDASTNLVGQLQKIIAKVSQK